MKTAGKLHLNSRKNFFTGNSLIANIVKYKILYLFLVPGIIFFIIFHYIPMYGVIIAFKDFKFKTGIWNSAWVGFKHFKILFESPDFFLIFRNTLLISLYKLFLGFPGPIILAILLNEVKNMKFKRSIQTIVYFPHFLSWVIVGGIVFRFFSYGGVINTMLQSIGLEQQPFLTSTKYFRGIVVLSSIWKEIGWGTIVYMAALSAVDLEQYEAAFVDGANKFKRMWHITLPALRPTIIIVFILRIGQLMEVGFEQIFVLYNPGVYSVADVFSTYIYRVGIGKAMYSYTTAIGVFQSVIGLILVLATNKLANKFGEYGIW